VHSWVSFATKIRLSEYSGQIESNAGPAIFFQAGDVGRHGVDLKYASRHPDTEVIAGSGPLPLDAAHHGLFLVLAEVVPDPGAQDRG
jgi:hypothetical protein